MRRLILIVVALALPAAAIAQTGSGGDSLGVKEPRVTGAKVLRLPSDSSCVRRTRATVRFLPPAGVVFALLQVRTDRREAVRMTGVPREASATVRLNRTRTSVRVTGTTRGGQLVRASRDYVRCGRAPAPRPPSRRPAPQPVEIGGGDDG